MFCQSYASRFAQAAVGLSLVLLLGCAEERNEPAEHTPPKAISETTGFEEISKLVDFDSSELPAGLRAEGATVRAIPDDNGGGALEIVFSPDVYRPTVYFHPEQPWDWSSENEFHIAFDAKNTGSESVQLYLSITETGQRTGDRTGSANRSWNLASGEARTFYAVLDGKFIETDSGFKNSSPPPWDSDEEMLIFRFGDKHMDLGKVGEIALFVRGNITRKTIVVDNIRLRRNPEYDLSYLEGYVDEFGQNAKVDFPIKVHSAEELRKVAEAEVAALKGPLPDRSRFNGWKDGPRLEATGYFRTEKVNGKWWMVDPEGYLFFSNGLANVRLANLFTITGVDFHDDSVRYVDPEELTPEDSIDTVYVSEQVRETRYIASEVRNNMFTWLPEYGDDLSEHYSYRRSVLRGPVKSGETFSFYRANLERRYGGTEPNSYIRKWEEVTLARMLDWGFTSFGNWVDPAFYPNERVPYFANGWIIGDFKTLNSKFDVWAPMPDPFDPEFVRRARITINRIAEEIQGSPWCVGVFVDNEKSWGYPDGTVEQRYGVIIDGLSRNAADSPAKQAFTDYLREKHGSIEALNALWGTRLASWEVLASGVVLNDYPPGAVADLSALLERLSEEYFKVVHDTLEKALPNHLYMGARMANWGMPAETIKASVKYSDVLSFNIYEEGLQPHAWSFLEEIDLPTVIGEWHIGATRETGLYHPGLVQADGQADRARMYRAYLDSVLALDTMVGAHWFQYVDSPISGRAFDGENYNVGFVSGTDIPYPEMVEAAREFNRALYPMRYGNQP